MYNFYSTYLISFIIFSVFGLIFDIFYPEIKHNKLSLENVKKEYVFVSELVLKNTFMYSFPLFLLCELFYIDYDYNVGMLTFLFQYGITIGLGINIEYLIQKIYDTTFFHKYYKLHNEYKPSYSFMVNYRHKYDYVLNMFLYVFPTILRFDPSVINTWIILIMYKQMILDVCDVKKIYLEYQEINYYKKHDTPLNSKFHYLDGLEEKDKVDEPANSSNEPANSSNEPDNSSNEPDNSSNEPDNSSNESITHADGHYSNSITTD